jgi:hypothetical protein
MNKDNWNREIEDLYKDVEGSEMWEQKAQFNQKERAKMILDTLDDDPEFQREFNLQLRQRKLNKIKK